MNSQSAIRNPQLAVLFALLTITLPGCAFGPTAVEDTRGRAVGDDNRRAALLTPEVDPSRAYTALADIEPAIEPPARPGSVKTLSQRAARQITTARRLADQQRYTEAAIELERALRYDPNHPIIHRTLATVHFQAGNVERARIHAARALEADPDDATAHYVIGRCKVSTGDNGAAITAYRTALLCSDFDGDAETAAACHYELARALEAEGYLEAALAQYAAFKKRATTPDADDAQTALVNLLQSKRREMADAVSKILERLGRYAEAAEAMSSLPADSPDVARGSRCARLWLRAGRFKEALQAARAIRSDDEEVIQLLFEIHEQAGHPEQIVPDLRTRLVDRPDEPQLALNLAEALIRLDRIGQAEKELRGFLDGHPDADAVRMRLVDLMITQSAWAEALALCSDGIKRQPARATEFEAKIVRLATDEHAVAQLLGPSAAEDDTDHVSAYLRGILAAAADRLDRAETLLRQCYTQVRAFVPARVALAGIHLESYRYDEALKVAARAEPDVSEDARLEKVIGDIYERLDDLDQAELHFKAAMQLDRADSEVMMALAKVLRRSGEVNRAQLQLRVLLGHNPRHEEAREMLAFIYLADGKTDAGIEQLEQLSKLSTTPGAKARSEALLAHLRNPNPEAYRKALSDWMESNEPDTNTWLALGGSYDEFEQEHAREAYLAALALDPVSEDALMGLVDAERRLLNFESAISYAEQLLPRRPNHHAWRLTLIGLYTVVQDYATALALARREEARDDLDDATRAAYRFGVVRAIRNLGREEEVLQQLKGWADADPEDTRAAIWLADEYMNQDQPLKALPIFKALFQSDVDNRSSLAQLLDALTAAGRHEKACQYALDWVHEDPEGNLALSALITVLADADRLDDALELINCKLLRTQNRELFQHLAGVLLREAKRYDECIELTERLMDEVITLMRQIAGADRDRPAEGPDNERLIRQPNEPFSLDALHERLENLRRQLAIELVLAEKYRAAEERLMTWSDASGNRRRRFDYLRLLASCQQLQGNDEQAAETLERALGVEPDDIGLNNDVAYTWIDRGVRLEEAERMIRFALSRNATQGAYLDTYGWLLYKKGSFAEAKKWLLRATRTRDTDDAVILDHLGDACWRLGESEEAILHWKSAMAALAAREESEDDLSSDDRRVRDTTQQKIEAVRAGRVPNVAPVAASVEEKGAQGGDGPKEPTSQD